MLRRAHEIEAENKVCQNIWRDLASGSERGASSSSRHLAEQPLFSQNFCQNIWQNMASGRSIWQKNPFFSRIFAKTSGGIWHLAGRVILNQKSTKSIRSAFSAMPDGSGISPDHARAIWQR